MKPSVKYVHTARQLGAVLGIQHEELSRKWMKKPGWPDKTAQGWDVKACLDFWNEDKRRTAESIAGINSDVKRRKLLAEAEKAEIDVKQKLGRLIEYDDYLQDMSAAADIYKSVWTEFSQWFIALHPEPEVRVKLTEMENKARARIREKIDEAKTFST